ncbi:MAG: hypothetical protein H7145_16805 [Akkermansiaceae bacterium]|nr:hypothetical protein [Armatimonadota bacterium]
MSSDNKADGTLGNFKFNTVGREEATEVLRPQMDPATKMRNFIIALVAAAVLAAIVWAGFQKSGSDIFKAPEDGRGFEAPQPNIPN